MKRAAILALRCLLGLFFLAAGLSKVGAPLQTLAAVYSYQIVLPDGLALAIAYALPWVEIILGLALFSGFFLPLTLAATAGMLLAFTVLTAQAWWRELPIDCGCLDLSGLHPSLAVLATPGGATLRNIFLLALTALIGWLILPPQAETTQQR
jgi:Methylamine utilisation protein MauE.